MESCVIINGKERENNGRRRRECFQTSDDLPWKTLLWWKVNAAPCDLDSLLVWRPHGERARWGERCWAGKKRDDDYKRTREISSSTSMRIESPPLSRSPPNTFCLLPFTSYPVFAANFTDRFSQFPNGSSEQDSSLF